MRQLLCVILMAGLICSCQNKTDTVAGSATPSAQERNKAVALASTQAMNAHDVAGMMKDAAPDMIDYGNGEDPAIKGRDSVASMLKMMIGGFPDLKADSLTALADGNKVAVFYTFSGTFKNPMMGMKATNKAFHIKDVDLFEFNDSGKIVSHRSVQANCTMMSQLGVSH